MKLIVFTTLIITASAQLPLMCYHCEDCHVNPAVVRPCGYEQITSTTTEAPPTPPPATTGEPILTPPTLPGQTTTPAEPIITPPKNFPPTVSPPWLDSLPTIPVTLGSEDRFVSPQPNPYVCMVVRSIVDDREVVNRGCAVLGTSKTETCYIFFDMPYSSCHICMSHLCNYA